MEIHGFNLVKKEYIPLYKAEGFLYKHKRSGMEVFYVASDDKELFFSYAFPTLPSSNNGVFHIIEHTVLNGSKKYPVRDPFTLISKGSASSYMNALTCPDMTLYPAASPVKKDFDNIFSLYTDSVFHPLLRKETFLQEGIRLTKHGFDGVVFNEMRGDASQQESVVSTASLRSLFSTGPYSYESGGRAEEIANLTYEEYLETYKKFYSPSNARLFLYGKDANIEEKLALLDKEYLSDVKQTETITLPSHAEKWSTPKQKEVPFAALEGDKKGSAVLSFLTASENSDPYEMIFISTLVDMLLGSPSCPLYSAIISSGLCDDISASSGMSGDFCYIPFVAGMSGVLKENEGKVEEYLLSALSKIAKEGIGKDCIEAAIRRQEFQLFEIPGGIPMGFRVLFKCIRRWLRSSDLFSAFETKAALERLRRNLEDDPLLFEHWIEKELLNNPHRLYLYVYPDAHLLEREDALLSSIASKRGYNKKDEELFNSFMASSDSIEALRSVPHLTSKDIPDGIEVIKQEYHKNVIVQKQLTGGIVYADIAIDLSDQDTNALCYASLLSRLLLLTGVKGEAKESIHNRLRLLTGGYSCYLESGRATDGSVRAFLVIRLKAFPDRLEAALNEIASLLKFADVSSVDTIKTALSDIGGDFAENCEYSGHLFASSIAASSLTPSAALGEEVMGIKAWLFFDSLKSEEAVKPLSSIYTLLSERGRFLLHLTAEDDEKINDTIEIGEKFLSSFKESEKIKPIAREAEKREDLLYVLSSSVAYNAIAVKASKWLTKEQEAESVLSSMLSSGELYSLIRSDGGAYGANASVDSVEELFTMITYRDPHLKASFEAFLSALELTVVNSEDVEMARLELFGRLLKPLSPASKAILSVRRIIYGVSDEMRKQKRDLTALVTVSDVEKVRLSLIERLKEGAKASLAPLSLEKKEGVDFSIRTLPQL